MLKSEIKHKQTHSHVTFSACLQEEGWEEDTNDDGGDEEICAEGQTLSSLLGQFANASDYQGESVIN